MKDSSNVMKSTKVLTLSALGSPILVVNNTSTVESPIKDTPNKEHLSIKDKSIYLSQFLLYQYILSILYSEVPLSIIGMCMRGSL